ncbi:MAG: hypothetical protein HZB51_02430 [Chloroflexi bacterium]|nr:hypothetical protein [Chloroflexota bacterium]
MKRNSFNQRKAVYDFGDDRYDDLLQQAEQYRLEQRAVQANASSKKQSTRSKSPIAHLLIWTKSLITS